MLQSDRTPDVEETEYMTIEPNNEYTNRPVLPTPLQIIGWEDRRRLNSSFSKPRKATDKNLTTSTQSPEKSNTTPKPILKNNKQRTNPEDNSSGSNPNAVVRPPKPPKR